MCEYFGEKYEKKCVVDISLQFEENQGIPLKLIYKLYINGTLRLIGPQQNRIWSSEEIFLRSKMMNLITTLHFLTKGFILFSPIRFYSVYSNLSFSFLVSVDCILHEKLTMFGVLIWQIKLIPMLFIHVLCWFTWSFMTWEAADETTVTTYTIYGGWCTTWGKENNEREQKKKKKQKSTKLRCHYWLFFFSDCVQEQQAFRELTRRVASELTVSTTSPSQRKQTQVQRNVHISKHTYQTEQHLTMCPTNVGPDVQYRRGQHIFPPSYSLYIYF